MKYFLFFILAVTSFLTACEEEKENDNCVPSEQKTIKCDTNDDCTDYYNSNYYCNYSQLEDNKNCQSKFCFIDECKTSNINCGLGTCISEANYHICKCDENNPCNPGFVCNNENQHCLPICFSDEDCLKDKFSKGNKCSLDLYYCVE